MLENANQEILTKILNFNNPAITKQFLETLQSKNALYHKIIQNSPDLIWLKDSNGLYLLCNQRFVDFVGIPESDILGQSDTTLKAPNLSDLLKVNAEEAIALDPIVYVIENQATFANDGHCEVIEVTQSPLYDEAGNLLGILGIGHNVTIRKQSELKLQKSEERLALAMRGANDGLWDWNLQTDEVYYSPRWKSMLGYEPHELEHHFRTWLNLVHPEDKAPVLEQIRAYIAGTAHTFEAEMRMQHKDGQIVYVLSRAFLVHRNLDNQAIRLVGTHVDITERKKADLFDDKHAEILKMIATGIPAPAIYDEIALLYEGQHAGLRCSMLELENGRLLHGGAPSLPKEYCEAVHGLENGPEVGSCGTSTYTGKRVLVENIETDPKWAKLKSAALPHGLRCCWSEPIKSSSGEVLGAFGMYYNHPALPNEEELNDLISAARLASIVMERDHAQKRIRQLAYTDILTGLASRAHLYQTVEASIQGYKRYHHRFSLLYIDLDDFKGVNDSLGHDAGDLLLKEIAKRLQVVCSKLDFVARLSGDEFCIVLRDMEKEEYSAAAIAQRCLKQISYPLELCGRYITPACSIGIANFPEDGTDLATLLKAADTALYAAKAKGKNQYVFYEPELTKQAEYRFQIEQYLRQAIEKKELYLVFQPQIHLKTGKIAGIEALARWHHPTLGNIPPQDFIPTAERIGMIKPLTEWVLKTACKQVASWHHKGFAVSPMSVNISPEHFLDNDFVPFIQHLLEETKIKAKHLNLEVTESVVQTNPKNLEVFQQLKSLGVSIAIDDFGTGFSSFASLKHLTVDYLKLDKYFIDDMAIDRKSQVLLRSMIDMGHNLGHGIIAEGVETVEQVQMLRQLGCDVAQGYLFSRPLEGKKVPNFLRDKI
ncbi:bifunctional diguanylate cyclase/phosphodiesterase [[Limnothrix rosea] IAM M-220]|nr:bifunctional diguanylate cyclase/phosphodiesterase [[Limnothrix rosea] IAM M-220]